MARAVQPRLDIPTDKLAFIILKAREYDVKESDGDPDEGVAVGQDLAVIRRKFEEVLKLDPRHVRANIFLAQIDRRAGDVPSSLRRLQIALEANPDIAIPWKLRRARFP